jgi:hypothetical protein
MYVRERSFRRRRRTLLVPTLCPLDRFILVAPIIRNQHNACSKQLCDRPTAYKHRDESVRFNLREYLRHRAIQQCILL